jgi:hypothetical protein
MSYRMRELICRSLQLKAEPWQAPFRRHPRRKANQGPSIDSGDQGFLVHVEAAPSFLPTTNIIHFSTVFHTQDRHIRPRLQDRPSQSPKLPPRGSETDKREPRAREGAVAAANPSPSSLSLSLSLSQTFKWSADVLGFINIVDSGFKQASIDRGSALPLCSRSCTSGATGA